MKGKYIFFYKSVKIHHISFISDYIFLFDHNCNLAFSSYLVRAAVYKLFKRLIAKLVEISVVDN